MAKKKKNTRKKNTNSLSYFELSKSAFYGFTSSLPLLIAYQIMAFYVTKSFLSVDRSAIEYWLLGVFAKLGTPGFILLGLVGAGLIFYFYREKKIKKIPIVKSFYFMMLLEALVYSFFLGAVVIKILKYGVGMNAVIQGFQRTRFELIMLSFGAGYFEELVFRVIIFGGIYFGIIKSIQIIKNKKDVGKIKYLFVVIIGIFSSLLFSFAHHLTGDPFSPYTFWYRTISGLIFVFIYYFRGFGIASYTHSFYDLWIVLEAV